MIRRWLFCVFLLGLCLTPTFAQDTPMIGEVLSEMPETQTLWYMIDRFNLETVINDSDVVWTIFAPTEEAWDQHYQDVNTQDVDTLLVADYMNTLLRVSYHVTSGLYTEEAFATLQDAVIAADPEGVLTLAGGLPNKNITYKDGKLNDEATIISPAIQAGNGVIYLIDKVLTVKPEELNDVRLKIFPTLSEKTNLALEAPSLASVLQESGQFGQLLTAADSLGLTAALDKVGPYTIFAPTDEAFDAWLSDQDMTMDDVTGDPQMLLRVLAYHLVPGYNYIEVMQNLNGVYLGTMLPNAPLLVGVNEGVITLNGTVTVTGEEQLANNGVIWTIDGVLVPPEAE